MSNAEAEVVESELALLAIDQTITIPSTTSSRLYRNDAQLPIRFLFRRFLI